MNDDFPAVLAVSVNRAKRVGHPVFLPTTIVCRTGRTDFSESSESGNLDDPYFETGWDNDENIKKLQREYGISDARVEELCGRAVRLFNLPHIHTAIWRTSELLLAERIVTAGQVRKIYREKKRLFSKPINEVTP